MEKITLTMRVTGVTRVRRVAPVSLAVMGIVLAAVAARADAEVVDRVLAVVGAQVVTLSDLRAAEAFGMVPAGAKASTEADVLSFLVDRELMLGEVDRYSMPDPERTLVDRKVAQIRARFPDRAEYDRALARTAMTDGRLRSIVSDTLRIESYLEQRFSAAAQPAPDEVQRYYRDHAAEFTRDGRLAPFDDVQPSVLEKLAAERKATLVAEWLDRLRRRAGVTTPVPPPR